MRLYEDDEDYCTACGVPLTKHNTEHHHFPLPKSMGGESTIPLCKSCHDMVDRVPLTAWPLDWMLKAFHQLPREGRLLCMKLTSHTLHPHKNPNAPSAVAP